MKRMHRPLRLFFVVAIKSCAMTGSDSLEKMSCFSVLKKPSTKDSRQPTQIFVGWMHLSLAYRIGFSIIDDQHATYGIADCKNLNANATFCLGFGVQNGSEGAESFEVAD